MSFTTQRKQTDEGHYELFEGVVHGIYKSRIQDRMISNTSGSLPLSCPCISTKEGGCSMFKITKTNI